MLFCSGKGQLAPCQICTKKKPEIHPTNLRHIGEPLQDGEDTLKVIWHGGVRDSVVVHDLDPSQLVV